MTIEEVLETIDQEIKDNFEALYNDDEVQVELSPEEMAVYNTDWGNRNNYEVELYERTWTFDLFAYSTGVEIAMGRWAQ